MIKWIKLKIVRIIHNDAFTILTLSNCIEFNRLQSKLSGQEEAP